MNIEPYVSLPRNFDSWGKDDEVASNQMLRQETKWAFYRHAFDYLKDNRVKGNYLEFGCHRARTFRMALSAARMENMDMNFYAFDSFCGLPEGDKGVREDWTPGALTTTVAEFMDLVGDHGVNVDRVYPIEGFYRDSLTREVKKTVHDAGGAAFVCVDCDLKESADQVFRFLQHVLNPGSVIYLDDWNAGYRGHPAKGVKGAWNWWVDWNDRNDWLRFEPFMDVGWWGKSFIKC